MGLSAHAHPAGSLAAAARTHRGADWSRTSGAGLLLAPRGVAGRERRMGGRDVRSRCGPVGASGPAGWWSPGHPCKRERGNWTTTQVLASGRAPGHARSGDCWGRAPMHAFACNHRFMLCCCRVAAAAADPPMSPDARMRSATFDSDLMADNGQAGRRHSTLRGLPWTRYSPAVACGIRNKLAKHAGAN